MKNFWLLIFCLFLLIGCKDSPTGSDTETGILEFYTTVWNAWIQGGREMLVNTNRTVYTVDLIDIRHLIPEIQVTTDVVAVGVPANSIEWITIYESEVEMLHTEREISLEIPAGDYKCLRITQRNLLYWVCEYQSVVHEFPSYNDGDLQPDDLLVEYLNEDGLYLVDDQGYFQLNHPGEKLGTFEVLPDMHTRVTMRLNIQTIDWHDNDNNGLWSGDDELDNWATPEGIDTMTDFLVEYY